MKRKLIEKMVIAATFAVFAAGLFIPVAASAGTGCSPVDRCVISRLKTVEQNYRAHLRAEALRANKSAVINESGPATLWLAKVAPEDVNMVTNMRAGKKQSVLSLNGKAYYSPGNAYAVNMSQNPSTRVAKDPLTNKSVDKADAVIYADASGRVYYFESEDTYKGFIGLANTEREFAKN